MLAVVNEFTASGEYAQAADEWRQMVEHRTGFKGFLTLRHEGNHLLVVLLWESEQASQGWSNSREFQDWAQRHASLLGDRTRYTAEVMAANLTDIIV